MPFRLQYKHMKHRSYAGGESLIYFWNKITVNVIMLCLDSVFPFVLMHLFGAL